MATKIGRSVVAVKTHLLEWVVGPTPGIARVKTNWKMEVWELTKRTAVMSCHESETALLKKVYEQLRPRILVYGHPDPIFWPRLLRYSWWRRLMVLSLSRISRSGRAASCSRFL